MMHPHALRAQARPSPEDGENLGLVDRVRAPSGPVSRSDAPKPWELPGAVDLQYKTL